MKLKHLVKQLDFLVNLELYSDDDKILWSGSACDLHYVMQFKYKIDLMKAIEADGMEDSQTTLEAAWDAKKFLNWKIKSPDPDNYNGIEMRIRANKHGTNMIWALISITPPKKH